MSKNFGKNYTELYKDTTGSGGFARLNPYTAGSFSISFISVKTLFESSSSNQISSTFQKFENYRSIISERLGKQNAYSGNFTTADGYAKGYGKYAQDVLIPAFIAAYSGKSPNTVSLIQEDNPKYQVQSFFRISSKTKLEAHIQWADAYSRIGKNIYQLQYIGWLHQYTEHEFL